MKLLAWIVMSLLLVMPPLALADKGERDKKDDQKKEQKHDQDKPKVPKVVVVPPVVIGTVAVAQVAVVPFVILGGGMVAMLVYDVFFAKYPPGFAGQQWDSCANAPRYSAMEKKCFDAGFLH